MKKIFLLFTFILTGFIGKAQINAVNDTVQIIPNQSISPVQFRSSTFSSGGINYRIPYLINPSTGKLDFTPTGKYLRAFYLPVNNPEFKGLLSSINQTPIDSNWSNPLTSVFFASSHDSNEITLQSGIGGAGINLIDSSQSQNNREVSWMFIDGAITARSHKDNTVKKRDLFTLDTLGNGRFLSNIFQNGNQVANDNTVVHRAGTETITGNKIYTGYNANKLLVLGDNTTNLSTGNSWNISQNSLINSMRWIVPSTNAGPTIHFDKNGSNTLRFEYFNGGNDVKGATFDFNGTLKAENAPSGAQDVVNLRSLDSLRLIDSAKTSAKYIDKTGDVMTDTLDIGHQVRTYNTGYTLTNTTAVVFSGIQNVLFDGTYWWILGTTTLKQYDTSFTLINSYTNMLSGVTGGINHLSGIVASGTHFIITASGTSSPKALVYNKADMSLLAQYTLPAGVGSTGIALIRDSIYSGDFFSDGRNIYKTDTATFSHSDTLKLSSPITGIQGMTYDGTHLILFSQSGVYTSNTKGKNVKLNYFYNATSETEGGTYYGGSLYWLIRSGATTNSYLLTLTPSGEFYPFAADPLGNVKVEKALTLNNQLNIGLDVAKYPLFTNGVGLRNKLFLKDPQSTNIGNHIITTNGYYIYDNMVYNSQDNINIAIDTTKSVVGLGLNQTSGYAALRVAKPGSTVNFTELRFDGNRLYPATSGIDLGGTSTANKFDSLNVSTVNSTIYNGTTYNGTTYNGSTFVGSTSTTSRTPVVLTPGSNYTGSTDGSMWVTTSGSFKMRYGSTTYRTALFNDASSGYSGAYLKGNSDNVTFTLTAPSTTPTSGSTDLITSGGVYTALNGKQASFTISGLGTNDILQYNGTNWQNAANTYSAPLIHSGGNTSINPANTSTDGYLSATDWNKFNDKQAALTLTTTGSGAATLVGNTLNIPSVSGGVTNVATGYGLSGGPITTTGTLAVDTTSSTGLVSKSRAAASFALKANDANTVHKTGTETIAGQKTWSDNAIFSGSVSVGSLTTLTSNQVQVANSSNSAHLLSIWGGDGSFAPSYGWTWTDAGTSTSLVATQATSNRTLAFPDASGTVALTSDITAAAANPYSTSATPSIVVNATHAGTGYTISIAGTNQDGVITLTTGASPSGVGAFLTVTMSGGFAYPTTCVPVLQGANATTSGIVANITCNSSTTTSWDVSTNTALTGGATYKWNYHNGGY